MDLGREFAARLEHSVPQLRSEQLELIDPDKNPFFGHARVQLFTPEGRHLDSWGSPGFEPGMLNGPWAVVVDSKDRVSVVDSNNHRVQRFTF